MEPRTANGGQSIWRDIPENVFRSHIVNLALKSHEVPKDPQTYSAPRAVDLQIFNLERILAQDFAFIAAAEEGVDSTSAACVEGILSSRSLVLRIASNEGVQSNVRSTFEKVLAPLRRCANGGLASSEVKGSDV